LYIFVILMSSKCW